MDRIKATQVIIPTIMEQVTQTNTESTTSRSKKSSPSAKSFPEDHLPAE